MGRYWELAMKAGAARVETLALTVVAIDPAIAAIVGRTSALEVAYRINWVRTRSQADSHLSNMLRCRLAMTAASLPAMACI